MPVKSPSETLNWRAKSYKHPRPYRRRHGRSRQIGNGRQRSGRKRTGAGLLLGELVDEHGDPECVRGLGGDEEVVVVVDDEADEDERGHPRDDGEEGLDLGRLAPHPGHHHGHRPPRRTPHLPPLADRWRRRRRRALSGSGWARPRRLRLVRGVRSLRT